MGNSCAIELYHIEWVRKRLLEFMQKVVSVCVFGASSVFFFCKWRVCRRFSLIVAFLYVCVS